MTMGAVVLERFVDQTGQFQLEMNIRELGARGFEFFPATIDNAGIDVQLAVGASQWTHLHSDNLDGGSGRGGLLQFPIFGDTMILSVGGLGTTRFGLRLWDVPLPAKGTIPLGVTTFSGIAPGGDTGEIGPNAWGRLFSSVVFHAVADQMFTLRVLVEGAGASTGLMIADQNLVATGWIPFNVQPATERMGFQVTNLGAGNMAGTILVMGSL